MDREFFGFIGIIVSIAVILTGLFFGVYLAANLLIDKPACAAYGKLSHQETYFSLGTSCLVKYNGEWVKFYVATGSRQQITIK